MNSRRLREGLQSNISAGKEAKSIHVWGKPCFPGHCFWVTASGSLLPGHYFRVTTSGSSLFTSLTLICMKSLRISLWAQQWVQLFQSVPGREKIRSGSAHSVGRWETAVTLWWDHASFRTTSSHTGNYVGLSSSGTWSWHVYLFQITRQACILLVKVS